MRRFQPLGDPYPDVTLSYLEHGPAGGEPVLCVHGLTRNAHDFDHLARALAERGRRVLAVDMVGRGRSSWLAEPSGYTVENYARHLARFHALMGLGPVDWVGTSMGGLIGIEVAANDLVPIRRLVINDIGPFVPDEALGMIRSYLGLDLRFASLAELEAHLRFIHAGFGPLSDADWHDLARHSAKETPEGWRLSYDPRIREAFQAHQGPIDVWAAWDRITCPTFVLHGADSPLLTTAVLEAMRQRGPKLEVVSLPGIGHAPALNTEEQIAIVARWLGVRGA